MKVFVITTEAGTGSRADVFTNYPREGAGEGLEQYRSFPSQDTCPPHAMTMDSMLENLK
jgi:hypothetical protein